MEFETWIQKEPVKTLVEQEQIYLSRHKYDLPIDVKLFKSIKYYYIKKEKETDPETNPNLNPDPPERKVIRLPKELLSRMTGILNEAFSKDPTFKPSKCFVPSDYSDMDIPLNALKKAFNNQYYQMKHKKYGLRIDV